MAMTGQCLCGAVRYRIDPEPDHFEACHCEMCRRVSGGIFLAVYTPPGAVHLDAAETLVSYRSSDWAEREFCSRCGSSLFYRYVGAGPRHGCRHVGAGTLDDLGDLPFTQEIFIDRKPGAYAFAGARKTKTAAEILEIFASLN